ncbi:TRAP transporter small permease [Clostridium sp. E02]|uniref:TRAP transporter small permease n=1 Tax=Clostridium sp. E02 TaxID=2487134 RepID=UPI000F522532|nr:TRAP transporter small permease [Clostridium sp. E02]
MMAIQNLKAGIMKVLGVVIIFLFAAMTLIGTYQIVTRYFFNRPSTISEELLTYTFTWMSLFASAYVFGQKDHMRIGYIADKITGTPKKYLEFCIEILAFVFAGVVMVYGGLAITKLTMIQTTASLRIPMGYIYAAVPASGLLIMIFSVMNAIDILHTDFSKKKEETV